MEPLPMAAGGDGTAAGPLAGALVHPRVSAPPSSDCGAVLVGDERRPFCYPLADDASADGSGAARSRGLSKKKPEAEAAATSGGVAVETAPAPDAPAEQAPLDAPSRAASLEKSECASLYSGSNIVFDFVLDEGDHREEQGGAPSIHGYYPSPCFDLPVELIRAGERFGVVAADSDGPVTTAFVFGDDDNGHRGGGALQKMASCLAPGGDGNGEPRPLHLVRFLSASGRSSVARPPVMVMPSRAAPQGLVVDS